MSARPQLMEHGFPGQRVSGPSVAGHGVTGASAEERGLSLLTFRAWALLSRGEPLPDDLAAAARAVLEELPVDLLGGRYAMFEPEVRSTLPPPVIESWRFYAGSLEVRGYGQVHVVDVALSAAHDDVYVVHTATADGDGYLEVYAADGLPLASGRTREGRVSSWDEVFGAVRDDARRRARA